MWLLWWHAVPSYLQVSSSYILIFVWSSVQEMYDYTHIPGRAVLHRGRHRHGARATSSGLRINLLLWCRRYTGLSLQFSLSHECIAINMYLQISMHWCLRWDHWYIHVQICFNTSDLIIIYWKCWCSLGGHSLLPLVHLFVVFLF